MKRYQLISASALICLFMLLGCNKVEEDSLPVEIEDDAGEPTIESMNFSLKTFVVGTFSAQDIAFKGDSRTNSLYIGYKDFSNPITTERPTALIQYDLVQDQLSSVKFNPKIRTSSSRQIEIIDEELFVISGDAVFIYPFPISQNQFPQEIEFTGHMTRFGSALLNDEIIVIGGNDAEGAEQSKKGRKVRIWDKEIAAFDDLATLPEAKYWADGEVVNNRLYLFGGQSSFSDNKIGHTSIYAYDFSSDTFESFQLPKALNWTFTERYEDRIFVGGQIWNDTHPFLQQFFGVFDTKDNSFKEIRTNLPKTPDAAIYDLTIVNDRLYVLHGVRSGLPTEANNWAIYEARIR